MIHCKNCDLLINENDNFCKDCGAKHMKERVTLKSLFANLLNALGWESNFFITLRYLLYKPHVVLSEYLQGTRKKYTNPFSLFAITIAISIFTFSQYSEEFIKMSTNFSLQQTNNNKEVFAKNSDEAKVFEKLGFKDPKEVLELQLKYYNFFAFLFLPIYTLIAFLVFRKPYNFGEHLLINTYLQSITSFLIVVLFLCSLLFGINLLGSGVLIIPFLYYSYAYAKLYKLTFGQILVKTLKFLSILLLLMFIMLVIGIISVFIARA